MRAVHRLIATGDGRARLGLDVYVHRLRKYIGAYGGDGRAGRVELHRRRGRERPRGAGRDRRGARPPGHPRRPRAQRRALRRRPGDLPRRRSGDRHGRAADEELAIAARPSRSSAERAASPARGRRPSGRQAVLADSGAMAETRTVEPADLRTVATGLRFPEGPVALADGSVLLVEIARGRSAGSPRTARSRWWPSAAAAPTAPPSGPTAPRTCATTAAASTGRSASGCCSPVPRHRRAGTAAPSSGSTWPRAGDDPAHRERRRPAARPERPGARRGRGHLVHRPRRAPGSAPQTARGSTGAPTGSDAREVTSPLDAPNGIGLSPPATTSTSPRPTPGACTCGT